MQEFFVDYLSLAYTYPTAALLAHVAGPDAALLLAKGLVVGPGVRVRLEDITVDGIVDSDCAVADLLAGFLGAQVALPAAALAPGTWSGSRPGQRRK